MTTVEVVPNLAPTSQEPQSIWAVVFGATVGQVLEWYDFFLYASLAGNLAKNFFTGVDPSTGLFFALVTFAVGFMVRPMGSVIFGKIGDSLGRKKAFLITIVLMGVSTVTVGLIPPYKTLGIAAPLALITARVLQGLALGGSYQGANTFVAEHSTPSKRAQNTSWVATTGTIGLLVCFVVILFIRWLTGNGFDDWGWRVPFLLSLVIIPVSLQIQNRVHESPVFAKLQKERRASRAPFREAFGNWQSLKKVIIAFFMTTGMTTSYYTATIFSIYFLTNTLKVDAKAVNYAIAFAAATSVPFYVATGWLCCRIGKKPVLVGAYLLTAVSIFPVFKAFTYVANPALALAQKVAPIVVEAPLAECGFLFNPTGTAHFTAPCDVAKRALTEAGVSYTTVPGTAGRVNVRIGGATVTLAGTGNAAALAARDAAFEAELRKALQAAGYPSKADPKQVNLVAIYALIVVVYVFAAMSVVAISPSLIEMFPTRIRYTAMGVPYNIAVGFIGGLLPSIIYAVSAQWGNVYAGLWYPVSWILLSASVSLVCYREIKNVDLNTL